MYKGVSCSLVFCKHGWFLVQDMGRVSGFKAVILIVNVLVYFIKIRQSGKLSIHI